MPNTLDVYGLSIKTLDEIKSAIIAGMQAIYGSDINVDQNSPDGQLVNIFAQVALDNLELLQQIYNTFSVNNAVGQALDQRVALNGLSRQAGTFTFVDIDVVTSRALNLVGLDAELDVDEPTAEVFTVKDDAGNKFYLVASQTIAVAGTYTYSFRAAARGAVLTSPNTITNQDTVTLGVISVNNPDPSTSVGIDEETDAALRIRHSKSFNLASTGPADAIEAAILSVTNVTDAAVIENDTGSESPGGVPAKSIWAIVEGGLDADIAQAIYAKKTPGCGQTGSVEATVTRPNGTLFTAKFDRPVLEDLYIKFTIIPRTAGITFDTDQIKADLAAALSYRLLQSANIGDIIVTMFSLYPDAVLTEVGVSDNGSDWEETLDPTDYQSKFSVDASRITVTA